MTLGLKFLSCIKRKIIELHSDMFFSCNKCVLVRLWVKVFVSKGWVQDKKLQCKHDNSVLIS